MLKEPPPTPRLAAWVEPMFLQKSLTTAQLGPHQLGDFFDLMDPYASGVYREAHAAVGVCLGGYSAHQRLHMLFRDQVPSFLHAWCVLPTRRGLRASRPSTWSSSTRWTTVVASRRRRSSSVQNSWWTSHHVRVDVPRTVPPAQQSGCSSSATARHCVTIVPVFVLMMVGTGPSYEKRPELFKVLKSTTQTAEAVEKLFANAMFSRYRTVLQAFRQ